MTAGGTDGTWLVARLADALIDEVLCFDHHGHCVHANPAAQRTMGMRLGLTPAELLGRSWPGLGLVERDQARLERLGARVLADGQAERVIVALGAPERAQDYEVTLSRMAGDHGPYLVVALRDVTTRRDVEAASAQLAAILDASDDAILAKRLDGTIVTWSSGAQRLYGHTAGEVVGCSVDLLARPRGEASSLRSSVLWAGESESSVSRRSGSEMTALSFLSRSQPARPKMLTGTPPGP